MTYTKDDIAAVLATADRLGKYHPLELTAEQVIKQRAFYKAVKTAPTKIRPFTQDDVSKMGSVFRDLEGREQRVEIGRYLCIGVEGERWTCSEKSMQDRKAVGEPDAQGFTNYVMRNPVSVLVTFVSEPFRLHVNGGVWESAEPGGVITWNGKYDSELSMRVIKRTIFEKTYRLS